MTYIHPKELLSTAGRKGGLTPKHYWTNEERSMIRQEYDLTSKSVARIASIIGVTPESVRAQIKCMGIAKARHIQRRWSKEEDDVLIEFIGHDAPITIAKRLGRSVNSVISRSKRLGLQRRFRDGWYTKTEAADMLGVHHKWIQRHIDAGRLKASVYNLNHGSNKSTWCIREKDFARFIRRYPEEINGKNVDMILLVDLLAGLLDTRE